MQQKNRRGLRQNLIFAALVLALAAGLALWRQATAAPAPVAQLDYTGGQMTIALDRDATYDIVSGDYTSHLQVQNGALRFVDSPCPDHVCENFGWLSRAGDWAACLPAKASLTLLEPDR